MHMFIFCPLSCSCFVDVFPPRSAESKHPCLLYSLTFSAKFQPIWLDSSKCYCSLHIAALHGILQHTRRCTQMHTMLTSSHLHSSFGYEGPYSDQVFYILGVAIIFEITKACQLEFCCHSTCWTCFGALAKMVPYTSRSSKFCKLPTRTP